jgi:hypothetical protein
MSKLTTTTSGTRPSNPADGTLLYETDTKNLIFWDGTVWRVYNYDRIAYSTSGASELHYPTGLWSSASATYYLSTSPTMHFDARILDGTDTENNPADGTAISTWANRSGNSTNYDATQSSAAFQPTFTASGPGSKPAVTWATDQLELAEYTTSSDITQISVSQSTDAKTSAVTGPAVGSTGTVWNKEGGVPQSDFIGGSNLGDVSAPESFAIHTVKRDTGSMTLFENGGTVLGTASNSGVLKVGRLGKAYPNHAGTISEILLFNSALSTADLNVIRLYLDNKYDLTSTAFS